MPRYKINDALVSDVLEAIIIDRTGATPEPYFFGLTTADEISQTVETEKLKAGIGNGVWAVMKNSKDMNVSVTYAASNDDLFAFQTGGDFEDKTILLAVKESGVYEAAGVTITGTPKNTSVTVIDAATGERFTGTFATGKVTVATTPPATGTQVYVVYDKELATQSILPFRSDEFPKNVELHLHGIAKKDGVIVADIYYVFFNAGITGNFTRGFQNGAPDGEAIEFELASKAGTTDYGFYTVVERA